MENMIGALTSLLICAAVASLGIIMAVAYAGRRSRELEAENAALSAELDEAKAQNAALSAKVDETKAKNVALSAEIDEAKTQNASLSAKVDETNAKNIALAAELGEAKNQNASLSAEIDEANAKNVALAAEIDEAKKKPHVSSVTQVAYDIAVDTWIKINDHLDSLGKSRRSIQPIYMLLAGREVPDGELAAAMSRLDGERLEEVHAVVADIRQFLAVHRPVIDGWLKSEGENGINSFCEAVRMPLGEEFDPTLDDDLMGDEIEPHATVAMVMRLGYLFPGSRNGCYRNKCKCVVAG